MAPLITNSRRSRSVTAISGSRMPHVFVIPPEEEQHDNPPWCCFDADEQPDNNGDFPSTPDIHFNDVPYLLQRTQPFQSCGPALTCRRTTVHGPEPQVALPRKLEKKQRPEAVKIIENKPLRRDGREDSDVVEVVKVKRGKDFLTDPEDNTKVKRSKTFKARATKALQSIKNVGKSSRRAHVKDLWTSSESMPGIFKGVQEQIRLQQEQIEPCPPATPTKKGSFPRRSLSQIFYTTKSSRPESPFPTRVASPTPLTESPYVLPSPTSSSLAYFKGNEPNPSANEVHGSLLTSDMLDRPASPSPLTKKTTRRFSVRELHKLFSFSSSSPDDSPVAVPFTPASNSSMPSTSTSTMSSDYPDVPVEEGVYAGVHFFDLESANQKLAPRYHEITHAHDNDGFPTPRRPDDLSFEMRLDSLHFDSLSFDPEDFDTAMEDNTAR